MYKRQELNNVNGKFPDKELIFTETSIGMWNEGRNLEKRLMEDMEETALGTVNNWCKAVIVWNSVSYTHLDVYKRQEVDPSCYSHLNFIIKILTGHQSEETSFALSS